jgi:hypothetical protein
MFFQAIEFARDSNWSLGAAFSLRFTESGNLELWDVPAQRLLWETGTEGEILAMQLDGNLVVYGKNREPVWASDTAGNMNAVLAASDDGRLMILSEDQIVLWEAPPASTLPRLPSTDVANPEATPEIEAEPAGEETANGDVAAR